jgi:site-specific recombinase XerD
MHTAFKQYLSTLKLSPVSRKLYLSDIKRFLSWLSVEPTLDQVSSSNSYSTYLAYLGNQAIAPSMLKRTTASLKQFGSFISLTYSLPNPFNVVASAPVTASDDYIKHFTNYLNSVHLSPLTIKSYKSDVSRYLTWASEYLPSSNMNEVLSEKNIEKYLNHLSQFDNALESTIERKSKSLSRIKSWYQDVYAKNYATDNTKISNNDTRSMKETLSSIVSPTSLESAPEEAVEPVKNNNSRKGLFNFVPNFITILVLLVFTAALAIFGYQQFARDVRLTSAFPNTPVTPNRQLSFQGRLEDAAGTPITTATDLTFKLWDDATVGSQLYSTGVCSLTPDSDGVFSTQIGSDCGASIPSSVFTENANVWLEVIVDVETLTPRQPIASVAYALNSETIQGFPISATVSAIRNTVVPMNQWGEIIVGEQSPRLTGVSGTFQISAPSLSFTTSTGSNGNINLTPDGTGQVNVNGNTTSTNFFNVNNAQLTTGSLITGTVANNNVGYYLLNLLSGSSPTSKFSVDDAGNTVIGGTLTLPNSNTLTGVTNYTQFSQGISVGGGTTYYLNSTGDLNANTGTFAGTLQANGTFDANGQVDLGDGGDAVTINGSSLTLTGFDCTGYTNGGSLTTNGSGVVSCSDDDGGAGGGGGSSNWNITDLNGTLSPINDTLDVLVGSNATASARAGLININSGTPTATLSAGTAGGAYLTATGNLATTANQTLTLGNNTTGNIVIAPGGVTALTAIGANLTAGGNLTLTGPNNLILGSTSLGETTSAVDSGAYLVGAFDEFLNSNSLNVQDVLNDLDSALSTALTGAALWTDAGTYLYPTSGEVLGNSLSGGSNKVQGIYLADAAPLTFGTDNDIEFSFTGSTLGSTLAPGTMIGIGTTTALATFDIRSSLGTIPTASISGNTSQATLVVDQSGSGDIFTASSAGQTRFVVKNNGNVGIDVSDPSSKLEIGGSTSTISNAAGDITLDSASNNISFAGDSLINILNTYVSGELGLGVADADAKLHVHGAMVGKALAIFNEIGDQDIFTASASGNTMLRIANSGNLSLTSDYINFDNTDGSTGYGFRDNGGIMEFKNASGSWTGIGTGGGSWWDQTLGTLQPYNKTVDLLLGGTATESAKIALININSGTPTATISAGTSGAIYMRADGTIATTAKQTLALGDATTTGNIILQGGNVGIGVSSPAEKLEVNGNVVAQRFIDTAGSGAYYLDAAAAGTGLSIDGDIVSNGAFSITSNATNGNITINAGSGTVVIGAAGAGKLDAGTIDPPYTINGEKYATYMAGMTGVKEETTGVTYANEYVAGVGYRSTLDLATSPEGSDLWLFSKASNLKASLDKLVVLLSSSSNTKTWYEIDPIMGKLHLYSLTPTTLSYRLTAPRYDSGNWANTRGDDSESAGHIVNDENPWSVSEAIANAITSGQNQIASLFGNIETNLISPLASGSAITITAPVVIAQTDPNSELPTLYVDGEIEATTISARLAQLQDIQAENITARNIVADTITANNIIGLDAKIASLSGISEGDITTITDRIKARLAELTGNTENAEDLPIPEEASNSAVPSETDLNLSSSSLASADIDFVTINDYLAVIGQATITNLDVTGTFYTNSISSKDNLLALQPTGGIINLANSTLIVDSAGQVAINGDLTVSGKILADSASINSLEIGSPSDATQSALGQLLSIYNEAGEAVATIDASGSANLASLTTNLITIASPGDATQSGLASLIGTAQSNATAGESVLVSPNTELTIESPYVTSGSLVYLTPTGNTENKVVFVKSKTSCPAEPDPDALQPCVPSFTVGIDTPASSDISFNWWIIELKQ